MSFLFFNKILLSHFKKGKYNIFSNYKYYNQWEKFLSPGHNSIIDESPWLTFSAIEFIKKHMQKNASVFEYGGGGSTLFFLRNAGHVVTVEHDRNWYEKLKEIINEKKIAGWEGNFVPPECYNEKRILDSSNPDDYSSEDENYATCIFKQYVSVIDKYPNNHFDWILIDGRARTSCLKHAFNKLKPGGFLVLDNAERSYYTSAHTETLTNEFRLLENHFGAIPFTKVFSQTNIWKKN